jgi:outer membrane protein insertion porin family
MRTSRMRSARTPFALAVAAALAASATTVAGASAAAAAVVGVDVEGAHAVSARVVRSVLVPDASAPFDPTGLPARVDSLLALLADLGRPLAAADVAWSEEGDGGVRLRVLLDEGTPARLDSLVLEGVSSADAAAAAADGGLRRGSLVTGDAVVRGASALLDMYGASGRPLASVRPAGAAFRRGGLALTLLVEEGPLFRFGDPVVSGNTVTKTRVVTRAAGIVPGAIYDATEVDRVRARLERLGIFGRVDDPIVAYDSKAGLAVVGVEVEEAAASRITGILGYDASGPGADGRLTGFVDVALGNIAGTGRAAAAAWERVGAGSTRTSFSYTEPWLLGAPVDVGVAGAQVVRDTVYTTTEGDLLVTARMGERTSVTWSVGGERYAPGATSERATSSTRTSLGADFDATDAPANPTRGVHLAGTVEYAAKEEKDGGRRERSGTVTLLGEAFLPVRLRQVVALAGRLAAISSTEEDVPFHEELVLGGARSLRGYREEQFRGTRTALGTVEYRFLLTRRSRALAFVDAGYYYRGGSNYAKGVKLGYGIGLRAETRLGIIALDYGLGEGDGLLDGKLHVGLSREF